MEKSREKASRWCRHVGCHASCRSSVCRNIFLDLPLSCTSNCEQDSQSKESLVQAQPSNVSEGMRQAADRLATGVGNMGSALRTPFSSRSPQEAAYRGGSGYGSAAVRALRAAPGAIAKPLSEGGHCHKTLNTCFGAVSAAREILSLYFPMTFFDFLLCNPD